jgi:ABC-2 type transport system ATP-binding protein
MVVVDDFHKTYRETVAVAGLTFRVEPGQILGLVGPNGAGKTTTIRALSGIIPPTRGRLWVSHHDVVHEPTEAKRHFAYIPDDPKLFDMLTIWEHLQFTACVYDVPRAVRDEQADRLLEVFELQEKRDTAAQELSRGMRQKVAISCAFLHQPHVIVFDEPLTGLDPRAIRTLKDQIRQRADGGAAVIISSHLLSLVEDICTHLLILHRGRQTFFGRLDRVDDHGPGIVFRRVRRSPSCALSMADVAHGLSDARQSARLRDGKPLLPALSAPTGDRR